MCALLLFTLQCSLNFAFGFFFYSILFFLFFFLLSILFGIAFPDLLLAHIISFAVVGLLVFFLESECNYLYISFAHVIFLNFYAFFFFNFNFFQYTCEKFIYSKSKIKFSSHLSKIKKIPLA